MPPRAKKEKPPKAPKMRKPRLGRAGRAGRAPAGKAGQKQTQKLVVNVGEKQPFAFPQQQGLTLQDLINFESTRGQRLGTREEPLAVKESVAVKPNLETLGSILMKPEPVITEAGSLEALKPTMRPRPVLSNRTNSFELNKSKPVKVKNDFLNQLENEIDSIIKEKPVLSEEAGSLEIMKSQMKPRPVLSEEAGSLEIMKSQMKPRPVLSESSGSFELNKPKMKPKASDVMSQTVEEVFNKPITTKSLFEQIAQSQGITPESIQGLQAPEPIIEKKRKPRSDIGISRKDQQFGLGFTLGSMEGINAGADIGIKEGIEEGRNIQNDYVMKLTKGEFGKFPGLGVRLRPSEETQLLESSSSRVPNFA